MPSIGMEKPGQGDNGTFAYYAADNSHPVRPVKNGRINPIALPAEKSCIFINGLTGSSGFAVQATRTVNNTSELKYTTGNLIYKEDTMKKTRVLFVCIHNSARSQIAEAWVNHLYGERLEARSAGLEPEALNPLAVAVMQEVGIDISGKSARKVFALVKSGELFSYVISVCDQASGERCPTFAGVAKRLHWNFPDPTAVTGGEEEKLEKVREIRDDIRAKIENWYEHIKNELD
jgi:arsenate reductase